jgi:hypothetical protein
VQFAAENEADVMGYFDHYIPPELIEIVVRQTNLYAQQQIAKMPRPVTKHAHSVLFLCIQKAATHDIAR